MDEVAEAASDTAFAAVKTTAGFAEIGHGREFAVDGTAGVPARVEGVAGFLRVFFVLEANIDITDEICWEGWVSKLSSCESATVKEGKRTVIVVVANNQLLD